ncbi:uncharacterized protein LOC112125758 isoform X2 [Terrapene carolina triunguis]|uniref:uncharacterized protein LOC112125758 isoform X2 n=1 Tax=Terrapene triunguis TaxID=2587831 RepID=UPI000E7762F1|nr:uncharacterized protein LOC112125758 isoform X2 [Terrapene carolina triunguis]
MTVRERSDRGEKSHGQSPLQFSDAASSRCKEIWVSSHRQLLVHDKEMLHSCFMKEMGSRLPLSPVWVVTQKLPVRVMVIQSLTCCIPVRLLVFHWAPKTAEAQEHRTVGTGSSVLLTALPINDQTVIKHIQWEYISSAPTHGIVDYYGTGTEPIISNSYKDRVIFYSSNGSLLLKNVQETDSGTYRATVNLNKIEARQTTLLVLEPMSKTQIQIAQIQINSTVAGSSIELSCKVLVGKVQAIDWKKDGKPLPRNRCYQVSENFSLLYIPEAQKSDCGSFSCNASNDISWQETSVNLTIEGIMPSLKHALKISTVALAIATTLAAGSGLGFIILCCQSEKKKITGELWRWLIVFIHGLVCVSAILMFTAAVFWIWEEGLSTALVLYMIFLTWVIMVTLLISVVLAICPQHLEMFKKKTNHRKKKSQEKNQQKREPVEVRMQCPRKPFHWTLKIFSLVLHSTTKTERSLNSARTFLSFQYFKTLYNCLCKYTPTHRTIV